MQRRRHPTANNVQHQLRGPAEPLFRTASTEPLHVASQDYPELAEILEERPPLERSIPSNQGLRYFRTTLGSKTAGGICPCCGGTGEHLTGFECYACDGSGQGCEFDGNIPCDGTLPDGGHFKDHLAATETPCQTPGAQYHVNIGDGNVDINVDVPQLDLSKGDAELLEDNMHNAMELVLQRYFHEGAILEQDMVDPGNVDDGEPKEELTMSNGNEGIEAQGVLAKWDDVQSKAIDIFHLGAVRMLASDKDHVAAHVLGDHGTYLSEIQFVPGGKSPAMWNCFLPDAPIMMADGTEKPISEIQVGDQVITHLGNSRPVVRIEPKHTNEDLVSIQFAGDPRPVVSTLNHELWVMHPTGNKMEWMAAHEIQVGDRVSFSVLADEVPVQVSCDHPTKPLMQTIKLDESLSYLVGWYLAEGFLVRREGAYRVGFALHKDETWVCDRLDDICQRYFGVVGTRRVVGNALDYRVSHWALYQLLDQLVGSGSKTKMLNGGLLTLPLAEQERLMQGWIEGDGHVQESGRTTLASANIPLLRQGREILARLGWAASLKVGTNPGGPTNRAARFVIGQLRFSTTETRKRIFRRDRQMWHKVESVTAESFNGEVWDMEVADDHSFRAYGANVHNCTCPWSAYSWGRSGRWKKYEGRMCSHALALFYQFQSDPKPIANSDWDVDKITEYIAPPAKAWRVGSLETKDYEGEVGNYQHITRTQKGTIPLKAIQDMEGGSGEWSGGHRNKSGQEWDDFKADIKANGIKEPIFIVVDPRFSGPKIYEGNHRRDAALEVGMTEVPVEIRYFGHAERTQKVANTSPEETAPDEDWANYLDPGGKFDDEMMIEGALGTTWLGGYDYSDEMAFEAASVSTADEKEAIHLFTTIQVNNRHALPNALHDGFRYAYHELMGDANFYPNDNWADPDFTRGEELAHVFLKGLQDHAVSTGRKVYRAIGLNDDGYQTMVSLLADGTVDLPPASWSVDEVATQEFGYHDNLEQPFTHRMLFVAKPGTRSWAIGQMSKRKDQREHIVGGRFTVLSIAPLDIDGKTTTVQVLQDSSWPDDFKAEPDVIEHMVFEQGEQATSKTAEYTGGGTMVAVKVPMEIAEALALEGGEEPEELHVTLAYLKSGTDFDRERLVAAVERTAAYYAAVDAEIAGYGVFHNGDEDVLFAIPSSDLLWYLRQVLIEELETEGIEYSTDHAWQPHITLMYGENEPPADLPDEAKGMFDFGGLIISNKDGQETYPFAPEQQPMSAISARYASVDADEMVQAVRNNLTDDLRKPHYQGNANPMAGHCYVASEALYHLLGGKAAGYKAYTINHEGEPHWFLKDAKGNVLDPTADQFTTPVPYDQARGIGFLTGDKPSKRAQTLLSRIPKTAAGEEMVPLFTTSNPLPGTELAREYATSPSAGDFLAEDIEVISREYRDLAVLDENVAGLWVRFGEFINTQAADIRKTWDIQVVDYDPYETADDMFADMDRGIYKVTTLHSNHPVWSVDTNVNFRVVHDITGHYGAESDFSFRGEVGAYQSECAETPEEFWLPLFTEVIAQTAYANVHHLFGEQKVGLIGLTPVQVDELVGKVHDAPDPTYDALHMSAAYEKVGVGGTDILEQTGPGEFSENEPQENPKASENEGPKTAGYEDSHALSQQYITTGYPTESDYYKLVDHYVEMHGRMPSDKDLAKMKRKIRDDDWYLGGGAMATLNDTPEPALPSTDGDLLDDEPDQGTEVRDDVWQADGVKMADLETGADGTDGEMMDAAEEENEVAGDMTQADGVGQFYHSASTGLDIPFPKWIMSGSSKSSSGSGPASRENGGRGGGDFDIAAAAREHLAVKTFSPSEQRELIDEGQDVKARNLSSLDLAGTHYEALETALAQADETGEDVFWWG